MAQSNSPVSIDVSPYLAHSVGHLMLLKLNNHLMQVIRQLNITSVKAEGGTSLTAPSPPLYLQNSH